MLLRIGAIWNWRWVTWRSSENLKLGLRISHTAASQMAIATHMEISCSKPDTNSDLEQFTSTP